MKNFTFFIFLLLSAALVINSQSQIMFTDAAPTLGVNDPGAAQGCVFLDINNDGFLDLFLINNNTTNKLWINNNGTSFTDVAATWGVSTASPGRGVSAGDFDNDGNIDMMVGNFNAVIILYKNTGTSFTNYTSTAGINFTGWGGSINWLDYNGDGKLDAIFGNDGVPYHYNYLFRNDNLLSFTNTAYTSGIVDSTSTLTITSADFDNDGDLDIFCGTQTNYGPATNFLYKNNGNGTFTDITVSSGLVSYSYTWCADWGDFDSDGDMDLYIGNSNAPNQLYQNNGSGIFTEVASTYGVADPTGSYSCGWADYDNDGDIDLYVANSSSGVDKLYRNDGSTFTDVASTVGTNDTRHSSCISWGDYNNDGFMDVYLNNNGTENRLYKNNAGNSNKWVILKLQGTTSNRSAIGARVKVKAGSLSMIREVSGGSGGKGQNSLPVEFGLGSASTIDSIIVRWPSGFVQGFAGITPNIIYSLTEGQGLVGSNLHGDPPFSPYIFALYQNYPNPFNPVTTIRFTNTGRQHIKLSVYDISGKLITDLVDSDLGIDAYNIKFDGTNLPSGIYFYKIIAGSYTETKKMILIK